MSNGSETSPNRLQRRGFLGRSSLLPAGMAKRRFYLGFLRCPLISQPLIRRNQHACAHKILIYQPRKLKA